MFYASVAFCLHFSMSNKHYLKTDTGWMFQRFFKSEMSEVQMGVLESDILIKYFLNYILTG